MLIRPLWSVVTPYQESSGSSLSQLALFPQCEPSVASYSATRAARSLACIGGQMGPDLLGTPFSYFRKTSPADAQRPPLSP